MMTELRELVEQLEAAPSLPAGSNERYNGYSAMRLPFKSGHMLALRQVQASSVGPGYTSVWHRDPDGNWAFYTSVSPRQACPRYFDAIARNAEETEINRAQLAGEDFGPAGPLQQQAHLENFWIRQRGIFAIGHGYFDSFDLALYSSRTSRSMAGAE